MAESDKKTNWPQLALYVTGGYLIVQVVIGQTVGGIVIAGIFFAAALGYWAMNRPGKE